MSESEDALFPDIHRKFEENMLWYVGLLLAFGGLLGVIVAVICSYLTVSVVHTMGVCGILSVYFLLEMFLYNIYSSPDDIAPEAVLGIGVFFIMSWSLPSLGVFIGSLATWLLL